MNDCRREVDGVDEDDADSERESRKFIFMSNPILWVLAGIMGVSAILLMVVVFIWWRWRGVMSSRRLFALIIILVLGSASIAVFFFSSAHGIIIPSILCPAAARIAIKEAAIKSIHTCTKTESFDVGGTRLDYVSISYGWDDACVDWGCPFKFYGLVDRSRGTIYPLPPINLGYIALREHDLSFGPACTMPAFFDPTKDFYPYYSRSVMQAAGTYQWRVAFRNFDPQAFASDAFKQMYEGFHCTFDGYVTLPSDPMSPADRSALTVTLTLPNCSSITDSARRELCVIEQARQSKDESLCYGISNEGRRRDWCFVGVAYTKNEELLCEHIVDFYPKDSCFANIAIRKSDSRICQHISSSFSRDFCNEEARRADSR